MKYYTYKLVKEKQRQRFPIWLAKNTTDAAVRIKLYLRNTTVVSKVLDDFAATRAVNIYSGY